MNRVSIYTLLVLMLLTGCQESETESGPVSESRVTVTDRLDRVVNVGQPSNRIISLSPAITELLFALDLGPQIVGATKHCNHPDAALEIPRVGGGTLESLSIEAILAARPDLVVAKWDSHGPLVDSLDRLKIPTIAIGAQSLSELFEDTRLLGTATGQRQRAELLIARMQSRRNRLSDVVTAHRRSNRLKVFYEVWDEPLMTAGPGSFINELMNLAGLQNIVTDTEVRYPRISAETVIRGDPDLILAPTTHFEAVDINSIASRPGWGGIRAVRDKRIHLISGDEISRCGPRLLDALAEIIAAAYPEITLDELANENVPVESLVEDSK